MKNDENIFERLKDMYIKLLKLTFCLYLLKFFLLLKIPVFPKKILYKFQAPRQFQPPAY